MRYDHNMPLKYLTPEHKTKLLAAVRGRPKSPEHREKISASQRGRKKSPEQVERLRLIHLGSKRTPEQRAAMSAARKGVARGPYPPERGSAISKALTGRTPLLNKYGIDSNEYARQIMAGNQWCSHRKHFAPASGFAKRSTACGACAPEYHRMVNIRRNFNVDQKWYDDKLAEQEGICAICGTDKIENKGHRFFCIDHDHATGHVRGLLCSRCNTAMERLDACPPNWGMRAAAYMEHYIKNPGPKGKIGKTNSPYRRKGQVLKPMGAPLIAPLPVKDQDRSD